MIESLDLCLAHHANSPRLVGARVLYWSCGTTACNENECIYTPDMLWISESVACP